LELFPGFRIPPEDVRGDVLVLAGDIGKAGEDEYMDFISDCVSKFGRNKVFVVLGNHEAYDTGLTWDETVINTRRDLEAIGAVLLHRDSVQIDSDLRIIGTTLWSHVDDDQRSDVQCFISDYRRIKGLTNVETSNAMHAIDAKWIASQIDDAEKNGQRVVVVTHHAPSTKGTSSIRNSSSSWSSAFATDLTHLFVSRKSTVPLWIFGHTHHACELYDGQLVSNPAGYDSECTGFDRTRVARV
jgi:predicted phosphodiesterase